MNLFFKGSKTAILSISLMLGISACSTTADLFGYDSATLNASAAENYAVLVKQANSEKKVDTTSNTANRIKTVFNRLKPYANQANKTGHVFNWEMTVIKSDEMNAWAMPGGKMAVYTGIVDKLKLTDAEIAAVIGHEMSHALFEHSKRAAGQQVLTSLGTSAASDFLRSKTSIGADTIKSSSDILSTYGIGLPFSRSQETEADTEGLKLMAQAGYNPNAAISVWEKMNIVQDNNNPLMAMTSTHPTNQNRIANLKKLLPEVMPIYENSIKRK